MSLTLVVFWAIHEPVMQMLSFQVFGVSQHRESAARHTERILLPQHL